METSLHAEINLKSLDQAQLGRDHEAQLEAPFVLCAASHFLGLGVRGLPTSVCTAPSNEADSGAVGTSRGTLPEVALAKVIVGTRLANAPSGAVLPNPSLKRRPAMAATV